MEYVASEDGESIKYKDGGSYSFNGKTSSVSYCSVAIGETVILLQGGVVWKHVL